ncbi:unnamed protein product [Thlaspi arvense]|uniref:Replication protein A 70 kDa DNA-binding subunit B/D first OB fold domain-containing protein n=1 Tax=Thlaspi arvense TaxID=13288 RepID=A0AAU9T6A9_THLAR|nr:unnamed protein product [Thlaspi arvense]
MASKLPITYVQNIKSFKSSWRIQVKILHIWKHFAFTSGESMEMVLVYKEGRRIHCSIKKQHLKRYENHLLVGSWKFIEEFNVSNSIGQYRTAKQCYRISFVKETIVSNSVTMSDSDFLGLVRFSQIHEGIQNQSILCDVLSQIVNMGQLSTMHVNNKEAKKIDFELRDERDMRLSCTLWGTFADQIVQTTSNTETEKLPDDGLALTLLESKPIKESGEDRGLLEPVSYGHGC